ncbi:MAG: hypothetical protein LBK73_14280 [Treponema sp.]|nr:hypothetical protein [Treponema sp.]
MNATIFPCQSPVGASPLTKGASAFILSFSMKRVVLLKHIAVALTQSGGLPASRMPPPPPTR